MSDEPTKTPATPLSTTAGNATLDDVLSSLQQQVEKNAPAPIASATEPAPQTSEAPISPVAPETISPAMPQEMPIATQEETKSADAPSIAEAVVPVSEEKPAENLTESIQPLVMASATPDAMMAQAPGIEPTTTQEVSTPAPFSIEEKTIEATPSQPIVPPTAEAMPESLSEHPAVNIEPVPPVSPTFDAPSTPPAPAPTPEKKGGLFGFAFNPKIAIAGVVALIVLVGSVVTYATFVANRTNTDTRDKACDWICTANCGCGCRDYFDNGRQSCYGTTNPTNAPGPTAAPSGCSSSAPTASACYGKAFGTNVGPCTCQRSGSSGNVCACVSNTTCAGAGGSCYTGTACSGLNPPRSVANGGNGCGPGIVCCAGTVPGATVKPSTTPAPTVPASPRPTATPGATVAPTAPPTGTCGANGQNCCDPFTHNGLICSSNLYCNTSTGKCQTTVPGGLCQTNGGTPNGMCEVYTCGSSCNLGNQCNLNKQTVSCAQANLNGQCGQIDYLNTNGQYCGVKVQNCGSSCGGTSTPPPTPRVTPTPTPVASCGSTCTTNTNCPTGLICSTGKCRNAACVTSTTCVCATPTPTPSPTPSPTPTPPPLACIRITSDTPNPVLGSQVRFTCGLVTGADRYEFRYKYTFGGTDVGGTLTATNNISEALNVSVAGVYKVQCRPCVGTACSQWEAW